MRRALRVTIVVIVVLAALLAVNTIVLEGQTRPAEQTRDDGELVRVSSSQLQYVDREPTAPGIGSGRGRAGEPIVLLHCFTCSTRWWDSLAPLLARRHRVIAFDLIGHGGSAKPASGYEIEAQAAAVAEALNRLGIRQATIVGHSMGGLVATSLAEQSSELVDRIVLIGTPSEPGEANRSLGARASTVPVLGDAIWRLKPDSVVKSVYASSFAPSRDVSGLFEDPDRVVEDLDAMTYTSYKESSAAIEDFLDSGSTASRLTTTGVPLLADRRNRGPDPRSGAGGRRLPVGPRRQDHPDRGSRALPQRREAEADGGRDPPLR